MSAGRNSMIALIHVAKRELSLCEENYRALLHGATGKNSLKDMNIKELEAVIKRFEKFGFAKKKSPKRAGNKKMAQSNQARMIRALWISLYNLGEVRDPSEDAILSYVHRMTGLNSLSWMTPMQANKVIGGLRDWALRAGVVKGESAENWAHNVLFAQIIRAFPHDKEARQEWLLQWDMTEVSDVFFCHSTEIIHSMSADLGRIIRGE